MLPWILQIQCLMLAMKCCVTMTTNMQFCDASTPASQYLPEETECPSFDDRFLTNMQVPWGVPGRAWYTIPPEITIKTSDIPNIGLGAFSTTFIQAFTWLGEYEGKVAVNDSEHSAYAWSSSCNAKETHLVDAGDTATSNWPRWVNCARNPQELNVVSLWCYGRVFYMSIKYIYPGQELLVYYGPDYAKDLGIDVTLFGNEEDEDDDSEEEDDWDDE